ncbi:response regulator [Sediminispirochaeta smaragdinae]|uniref:Response regulator receiver protein n=1 Tax=Sediminispirochaeta smaragdinae (strain DSM 11293 / JCM 15392 / SEBR 4228) TaxID=573413 RepID=E1R4V8_SEDSS|nr:response regulator [Sediminispirochaeta smaragdinae]ADK82196.1 response regulator receiver protein [Sediminispirochaeta smaragdinae DSM 11293]
MNESDRVPHILIAEDDGISRLYIATVLGKRGFSTAEADNGLEAVHLATQREFDLILMDVNMPEMNGMEATQLIRAHEKKQGAIPVPVIALTAHAYAEDIKACKAVGMSDCLAKPFSERQLLSLLEKFFPNFSKGKG